MANGSEHKKPRAAVKVLSKIPSYKLFRQFGWPRMLPMNITCSMLYRCNSRCLTCNIWEKKVEYFSVDEWDKTFQSLGKAPFWFTFSGGEPFLRRDIPDIVKAAYDRCHPGIVNIPTNAFATNVITNSVEKILQRQLPKHYA